MDFSEECGDANWEEMRELKKEVAMKTRFDTNGLGEFDKEEEEEKDEEDEEDCIEPE